MFLEILQNSQSHPWQRLFSKACNFIKKETPAQVFSYEFCEMSKNTCFNRTPPVAASGHYYFIKNKVVGTQNPHQL